MPVPDSLWSLMALVFVLGCRHGLDPDHLATIDGLTRYNAVERPRLSRWSGTLFSLGHGAVVTAVAALVAQFAGRWQLPAWVGPFGEWISILVLLALGLVNLLRVLRTPAGAVVAPAGLRARLLVPWVRIRHPAMMVGIGALFAVSFDTLSQAAVFSLAAGVPTGWLLAAALGLVFTLGMMTSDGCNGWWIAHLVARADRRARIASRTMSLGVALLSFLVAGLGYARLRDAQPAALGAVPDWALGLAVAGLMLACFALAMHRARRNADQASPSTQLQT